LQYETDKANVRSDKLQNKTKLMRWVKYYRKAWFAQCSYVAMEVDNSLLKM